MIWPVKKPYHTFLGKLAESGRPTRELVAEVVGLAVGSSVNYAQAAAQVVDFYLDGARANERAEIQKLVQKTDAESAELLRGYVREAQSTFLTSMLCARETDEMCRIEPAVRWSAPCCCSSRQHSCRSWQAECQRSAW